MIITNSRYALVGYSITSYPTRAHGIIVIHPTGKMKKSFGDESFSVAAPTLWNKLPVSLRDIDSIVTFKFCLKTYLFKLAVLAFSA